MAHESDLIAKAQQALGSNETVIASGVFGLQDNYAAILVGGLAADAVANDLPGGAATDAVPAGAGVHVARQVNAERQGVTVRMLVAVTQTHIHLLSLGAVGDDPGHEVFRFDRATTTCQESSFGASRHLTLTDSASGQEIGLTGSAAFFSAYAEGDKAVLRTLHG